MEENSTANPIEPIVQAASTTSETNPQPNGIKTSLLVLMSILVILTTAIAGFFAWQTQRLTKELASYQDVVETSPTPEPTIDPTAGWKTYIDSKDRFSFKYPSNLETLTTNKGTISGPITGNPTALFIIADTSTMTDGTDKPFNGIRIDSIDTDESFDTFVSNEIDAETKSYGELFDKTIKQLNNIPTQNWYIDSQSSISRYFLKDGNTVIAISVSHKSDDFLLIAHQIIASFKFASPTSTSTPKSIMCTQEAKLCPDGSYVGRTGTNCEFAACP